MPVLPTFDASLAPEPARTPPMNPAAAAQVPAAVRQAGAQAADVGADFEARYADAVRQANASNAIAAGMQQLGDLQFKYSHVADRQAARDGFQQEGQAVIQQTLAGISDPLVRAHVQDRLQGEFIARGLDTANAAFALESSKRRGELDANLFSMAQQASTATSPQLRAIITDNAQAAIKSSVAAGWLAPEEGATHSIAFMANLDKADALRYIRAASSAAEAGRLSPLAIADTINNPQNFTHLSPDERQMLADQAVRLSKSIIAMRTADAAHSDVMAERALRQTQAGNAARLIAQSATPGSAPTDPLALSTMVANGQLSESGFTAVMAAQQRAETGRDDAATAADLWRRATSGEDVANDALAAYADRKLSRTTAVDIGRAVDTRARGQETEIDKANFATLKSALNGYAVEQNIAALPEFQREEKAQLWSEAQAEWTKRVLAGRENSGAVLQDMLARYVRAPIKPQGLPQPRLGAVNSVQDVATVWARTKAQHAAGQMDDATFAGERALLDKYLAAYQAEQAQAAAAAAARAQQPGAKSPTLSP